MIIKEIQAEFLLKP